MEFVQSPLSWLLTHGIAVVKLGTQGEAWMTGAGPRHTTCSILPAGLVS
jgi:hypothetical protein